MRGIRSKADHPVESVAQAGGLVGGVSVVTEHGNGGVKILPTRVGQVVLGLRNQTKPSRSDAVNVAVDFNPRNRAVFFVCVA